MRKKVEEGVLKRIQYEVWTGDFRDHGGYRYWRDKWGALLRDLGTTEPMDPLEFLRQDKVTLLTCDGEIVGMHLIKEYARSQFSSEPYFQGYNEEFLRELDRRGARRVQALQYIMIDDKWSVANTLMNFGAILICLSLRHQTENRLDASISIARADVAALSLCLKLGFEELSVSRMHQVDVGLIACFEPSPYPKPDVNEWVDYYWKNRVESVAGAPGTERKAA